MSFESYYRVVSRMTDFFILNRCILKIGGLWKPDSKNMALSLLYRAYALGTIFFVNIFFTSTEFISLMHTYNDEYNLIKNINFALTHLLGAFKVSSKNKTINIFVIFPF